MTAAMPTTTLTDRDRRYILAQVGLGLVVFLWGIFAGLAQALDRVLPADSTLWAFFPGQKNYYQGLTAHGVFLAIVFTFAFSNGFMTLIASRSLGRRPNGLINAASFWLIFIGTVLAGWQIVANKASVLFTMYPPLQASPLFYLGLVLIVVSTWTTLLCAVLMYRSWRRENPGERTPLQAFGVLATYVMWFIASLGVALEVLLLLLPWSLGWIPKIDPQLARALFWYSGHPIVYFWLLPAYVSWYTMIPRQVGGKLLSDPLVRLAFILFLVLSTPTGLHHQFTDPGVDTRYKMIHLVMTMAVFFPSMLTAFSVMAALETGGRAAGGRGWFGWIRRLPWGDPSVTAQILAMLGFTLGGMSGLINASYNVNLVVHNTAWIPGHFHLTVGTAVALSFLGISYWLIPHLTGRSLMGRRTAVVQSWLWLIGVLIFSRGQMAGGLESLPRRLNVSQMTYGQDIAAWQISGMLTGLGGTLMFISGLLFFIVIVWTLWKGEKNTVVEWPVSTEMMHGPEEGWPVLDRWPVWIGLAILLILIAWGPFFLTYEWNMVSPGYQPWG
jgi:cytochrome c oxidase subunit 1